MKCPNGFDHVAADCQHRTEQGKCHHPSIHMDYATCKVERLTPTPTPDTCPTVSDDNTLWYGIQALAVLGFEGARRALEAIRQLGQDEIREGNR